MSREVYADGALLECDSARTTCYMCRRARPACEGTFRGGDAAIGVELCPSCCRAGLHESAVVRSVRTVRAMKERSSGEA